MEGSKHEAEEPRLSWSLPKVLGGAFIVASAVAAGVYALTSLAKESEINALKTLLEAASDTVPAAIPTRGDDPEPTAQLGAVTITIEQPSDGDTVAQFTEVRYSVVGDVLAGFRPILLVRDPLGQYWPWGSSPSGRHPRVQFGVPADGGLDFEIVVLVTDEDFAPGTPALSLPPDHPVEAIAVTRR